MQEDLDKIKNFQVVLKEYLFHAFGDYLSNDKISQIYRTDYIEKFINKSDDEIRGDITRKMLEDAINVECQKDIVLDDGKVMSLNYGEDLERALIEYYSHNIAEKYGFTIDEIPELKGDLETIKLLNEKLGGNLDSSVFTEDAVALLKKADFKELIEKCDEEALKKYLEKNKELAAGLDDKDKDKENEIVKENTERENSVQIVWLDGKKYIKYVDRDGKVSLTEILDNGQTEEFYKTKLANLKPGEKLDPEEFKHELDTYMKEMNLTKTEDVKEEYLDHKETNMLNFINSNKEIRKEAKKDVITNSDDMKIHVVESTNDIVVTKDKDYNVEAHIVKDGKAQAEREGLQNTKDMSSKILTKDEYQELIDKFSRGENLTLEELESLKRTSEYYKEMGESVEGVLGEKGPTLTPGGKKTFYGYSVSYFITLIVSIGAICSIILALYLFFTSLK